MAANKIGIWNAYRDCRNINYSDNSTNTTGECDSKKLLGVGLVFDVFSIIGSLFIISTFWVYKDQRTRARLFLLFIAICDFFTAVGYAMALIWSLANADFTVCHENKSLVVLWACIIESGIDMYFPLGSFFWTVVLGLHILCLFFGRPIFRNKVVFVCVLVAGWGLPLLNTLTAFFLNILGPGPPTSTAGWCFINYNIFVNDTLNDRYHWVFELGFAKFWDLSSMVIVAVLYTIVFTRLFVRRFKKQNISGPDFKLIFIPLVFFLLRIWGDTRWLIEVFSTRRPSEFDATCKSSVEVVLAYLQVVGDPGQGWANAILYILCTRAIRERIWESIQRVCCRFVRKETPEDREDEKAKLVNEKARGMHYY